MFLPLINGISSIGETMSNGDIGIVTILHERMHQIDRLREVLAYKDARETGRLRVAYWLTAEANGTGQPSAYSRYRPMPHIRRNPILPFGKKLEGNSVDRGSSLSVAACQILCRRTMRYPATARPVDVTAVAGRVKLS